MPQDHKDARILYDKILGTPTTHPMYAFYRQVYLWGMERKICMNGFSREILEAADHNDRKFRARKGTTMEHLDKLYSLGESHRGKLVFVVTHRGIPFALYQLAAKAETALAHDPEKFEITAMVLEL